MNKSNVSTIFQIFVLAVVLLKAVTELGGTRRKVVVFVILSAHKMSFTDFVRRLPASYFYRPYQDLETGDKPANVLHTMLEHLQLCGKCL